MKKIITYTCLVIAVGCISFFVADYAVKSKVKSLLATEVNKGNLTYKKLSIDLLAGNAMLDSVNYSLQGNNYAARELNVIGFSYFDYLLKKKIHVKDIVVTSPKLQLQERKEDDSLPQKNKKDKQAFNQSIVIDQVSLIQGNFLMKTDTAAKLKISTFDIRVNKIQLDSSSVKNSIPFSYKEVAINAGSLMYKASNIQTLLVDSVEVATHKLLVTKLYLNPAYSRQDYKGVIPYEKDLMTLKLDSLYIPEYTFTFEEFNGKQQPSFTSPTLLLKGINFDIYRDKTVNDDKREKDLYSKMLRKLPLKLAVDSLQIRQAYIKYEELIDASRPPGEVFFENLKADMAHITNIGMDREDFPTTDIQVSCSFMGTAPLEVNWQFHINSPEDLFRIRGRGTGIGQNAINPFFVPGLNMKAEGGIDTLYFDFSGNNEEAQGDLKLNYQDFKIGVLKKNGKEKNKLLSFFANVLMKNNTDDNQGVTSHVAHVKRDKTKSFWNYFWSCLFAGLKKSFF